MYLNKKIKSFDHLEISTTRVYRPESFKSMTQIFLNEKNTITRGSGLSYSLASGNNNSAITFNKFNRIISFSPERNEIEVEAGIKLGEFVSFLYTKGYYFPVLPGYPEITLGGCLAFNVHGKGQFKTGNFEQSVLDFELYHPKYGVQRITKENPIFQLSIGGMGLTGVILSIRLKILKIPSDKVILQKRLCKNFAEALEILINESPKYNYVYSWHDFNKEKKSFGKGIVFMEKFHDSFSTNELASFEFPSRNIESRFPLCLYNSLSIQLVNIYYYQKEKINISQLLSYKNTVFPIYGNEIYYRFFGKKGFHEYQVIIPIEKFIKYIEKLNLIIKKYKIIITLSSLKIFSGKQTNLNFSSNGICLALDFPVTPNSHIALSEIDILSIEYSGILNISKDSRINEKICKAIFNDYEEFKNKLYEYDPDVIFSSTLSDRIGITR